MLIANTHDRRHWTGKQVGASFCSAKFETLNAKLALAELGYDHETARSISRGNDGELIADIFYGRKRCGIVYPGNLLVSVNADSNQKSNVEFSSAIIHPHALQSRPATRGLVIEPILGIGKVQGHFISITGGDLGEIECSASSPNSRTFDFKITDSRAERDLTALNSCNISFTSEPDLVPVSYEPFANGEARDRTIMKLIAASANLPIAEVQPNSPQLDFESAIFHGIHSRTGIGYELTMAERAIIISADLPKDRVTDVMGRFDSITSGLYFDRTSGRIPGTKDRVIYEFHIHRGFSPDAVELLHRLNGDV